MFIYRIESLKKIYINENFTTKIFIKFINIVFIKRISD